jgi:serine/threonine-protein kinase
VTDIIERLNEALTGRYGDIRHFGEGAMAVVYRARDVRHARDVAIKVMRPEVAASIGIDRFNREIQILARLHHPHILPLFDSGESGGLLYFVMPFVTGESLRTRLVRERALPLRDTCRMVQQLARALDYAHGQCVVHRDVKPENVLLLEDHLLLADFGVASERTPARPGSETTATLTTFGTTVGTPAYMSPEQAAGSPEIDGRSDQYALAILAYEMVSGSPPFAGLPPVQLLAAHITTTPPPPAGRREPVPPAVAEVLARALAKTPDERFASCAEFGQAFERGLEARAAQPTTERARPMEVPGPPRVLVLGFNNLSGTPGLDWLGPGLTETVTVDLRRLSGLRVIGIDPPTRKRLTGTISEGRIDAERAVELAAPLGAAYVVWGSYQSTAERVRVIAQVASVEERATQWSRKLDGTVDDIFELQDGLVRGLSEAMAVSPSPTVTVATQAPRTRNRSALEQWARGVQQYMQFSVETIADAEAAFREALRLDPDFALAHAWLGALLVPRFVTSGRREDLDAGIAALERAVELDPGLPDSYAFLCYAHARSGRIDVAVEHGERGAALPGAGVFNWYFLGLALFMRADTSRRPSDMASALRALRQAAAVDRGYHASYVVRAHLHLERGEIADAAAALASVREMEEAGVGAPFIGREVLTALGALAHGRADEAEQQLAVGLARYPTATSPFAMLMTVAVHAVTGLRHELAGHYAEALEAFETAVSLATENPRRVGMGGWWARAMAGRGRAFLRLTRRAEADRTHQELVAEFDARRQFTWGYGMGATDAEVLVDRAALEASLGSDDQAVTSLSAAVARGWSNWPWFDALPAFTMLRRAPGVLALRAQSPRHP